MKVALVVNPFAGLGGPAGLKGSDALDTVALAEERGVTSRIEVRLSPVLEALKSNTVITAPGDLGQSWCEDLGLETEVIQMETPEDGRTTAEHTRTAVGLLQAPDPDLLLFVGGDGTARDVLDAVNPEQVVLGIPCGVKMHSAVFANNPSAAREVVQQMLARELVTVSAAEVRDIDEAAFREGTVRSKFYGEMWVPESLRYMQQVKSGGKEDEALVVEEIAADFVANFDPEQTYLMGSGSTTAAIMRQLGLPNTLLGVDVIEQGEVTIADAFERQLAKVSARSHCKIVVTVIGGQGHLFGRGNQQFSPEVIRAVGSENIMVVATKTKLESLPNGIIVDTGDAELDHELSGFIRVITGFEDAVLCPVSA
jgi:predicted polyphosphate/ATP-dependent NAD kinase